MEGRVFIGDLTPDHRNVQLCGWVHRLRDPKGTTFIMLRDCSGEVQLVADPELLHGIPVKTEDAICVRGEVRRDQRARRGFEIDVQQLEIVGSAGMPLPFGAASDLTKLSQEIVLDYRPLSLRTDRGRAIFKFGAAFVEGFRAALRRRRFAEIFSSKIVAGGTEGGSNLFEISYFERVAYLAQSPQFFKEYGVCGLERVFETGQVFRAEPHATSRHLTEFYSLDLEFGFISDVREVMELEREILGEIFESLRSQHQDTLSLFDYYLPDVTKIPIWDFAECVDRLGGIERRSELKDDLTPESERQLCALAKKETGVSAVFVVGYPVSGRPFYTHQRRDGIYSNGFDLLFRGVEVTTGGQRFHRRDDLERSLRERGIDPARFETHLRMFDLGMPPHGGLAIGAERILSQILGLSNIRESTMFPRDRNRVTP